MYGRTPGVPWKVVTHTHTSPGYKLAASLVFDAVTAEVIALELSAMKLTSASGSRQLAWPRFGTNWESKILRTRKL